MPKIDGLGVIRAIGAAEMPLTVFVTAFSQHAIRAFEANALDYLLKPFSDERFEGALARAKARLEERSLHEFGQRVMKMVTAAPASSDRRLRPPGGEGGWHDGVFLVRVVDVDWIEAAGVYVNAARGGEGISVSHRAQRLGGPARSAPLCARAPLGHREYRKHRAAGADIARGVRRRAPQWIARPREPDLPGAVREALGPAAVRLERNLASLLFSLSSPSSAGYRVHSRHDTGLGRGRIRLQSRPSRSRKSGPR